MNYRELLFHSLAKKKSGLSQNAINAIFARFDRAVALRPEKEEQIMKSLLDEYGNESFSVAMQSFAAINYQPPQSKTGAFIQNNLEQINRKNLIKTSPASRIMDIIDRYNKNIHKCGATLTSGFTRGLAMDILNAEELDALKMAIPKKARENEIAYQAWGRLGFS